MSIWLAAGVMLTVLLGSSPPGGPITVSAAISLSDVLEDAASEFVRLGGGRVRFNFAGSNVLARQIVNGAPADVFISADQAQMDFAERAGAILPGSRRAVASNQLAVVALPDRAAQVREAFPRAASRIRRLAIGDPAAVPAGVYARQYLERQGLWAAYEPRIVPTGNVRSALAAVENGSVDAAIVYVTDARAPRHVHIVLKIPVEQAPSIAYAAAVVAASLNKEGAERFLTFLQSERGRAIFARFGFGPPPGV
jgi:molybdate transport system substrate-binding protein